MFVWIASPKGSACLWLWKVHSAVSPRRQRLVSIASLTPVAGFSRENTLEPFLTACTSHINRAHLSRRIQLITAAVAGCWTRCCRWIINRNCLAYKAHAKFTQITSQPAAPSSFPPNGRVDFFPLDHTALMYVHLIWWCDVVCFVGFAPTVDFADWHRFI